MWPVVVGDPFVPRITLSKKVQVYDGPLETTARCKSIYVEKCYQQKIVNKLQTKRYSNFRSPPSDLYKRWGGKQKTHNLSQMKLGAVALRGHFPLTLTFKDPADEK